MRIKLLLFILFCNTMLFAQSNYLLSLDYLISLQKKSLTQINDNLIAKNWSLHESSPETITTLASTTWSYGINYEDKASGWIHLFSNASTNRLRYQFRIKSHYIKLKSSLSLLGFKLESEQVYSDYIEMIYSNKNNVIVVIVSKEDSYSQNEKYAFTIYEKVDYLLATSDINENNSSLDTEETTLEAEEIISEKIYFTKSDVTDDISGNWELFDIESQIPNEITNDEMYLYSNIVEKYSKNETSASLILYNTGNYKLNIDDVELNGYWNADYNTFTLQNNYKTATNEFNIVTRTDKMFFVKHVIDNEDYIKFYFKR